MSTQPLLSGVTPPASPESSRVQSKASTTQQKFKVESSGAAFFANPNNSGQNGGLTHFHSSLQQANYGSSSDDEYSSINALFRSGSFPKLSGSKYHTATTLFATLVGSHADHKYKHDVKVNCGIHQLKKDVKKDDREAVINGLKHILNVPKEALKARQNVTNSTPYDQARNLRYSNRYTDSVNTYAQNYNRKLGQMKTEAKTMLTKLGVTT